MNLYARETHACRITKLKSAVPVRSSLYPVTSKADERRKPDCIGHNTALLYWGRDLLLTLTLKTVR